MNPLLMIPFILTPIVTTIVTYIAMNTGIVPRTNGTLPPWTTPPIIGGFLATGSFVGSLMQLINLAIGFVIWFPFFKIWDKQNLKMEKGALKKL
jgi:PTS system cellobiose-specific IIC component